MTTSVPTVDWVAAQEALRDMVGRVTAMLRTITEPDADCLGRWKLSDLAVHLSQAWVVVPALARNDLSVVPDAVPSLAGLEPEATSFLGDVRELTTMTVAGVDSEPERDLKVLADRIEERAAAFFVDIAGTSAHEPRPWLVEGAVVDRSVLTCHLLNETIVHGYDIAVTAGRRFPVQRSYATLVLVGFIIPVIRAIDPRALVNQERAAGLQATFEVHLRGGRSAAFILDDGEVRVESSEHRHIDCHISADPWTMLLVAWGRKSQWPAIATGKFLAWGRKPWLGPKFATLINTL